MKFYHGTTKEIWELIKEEGVLWGKHSYRYTYLTPEIEIAKAYGNVILEIDYDPVGKEIDNYGFNPPEGETCWQFSVFIPIPLQKIKQL